MEVDDDDPIMEDEVDIDCVLDSAVELLEESAPDEVKLEYGVVYPVVLLALEVLGSEVVAEPLTEDTEVVDGREDPDVRDIDPVRAEEDEVGEDGDREVVPIMDEEETCTPALEVV